MTKFHLLVLITSKTLITLLAISLANYAYADEINLGLFSSDSTPYGVSYADWTAQWWQWVLNPGEVAATDENCFVGESGPVSFIEIPVFYGTVEATCTISAGKAALLAVVTGECDKMTDRELRTQSELARCAAAGLEGAEMKATIDGREVKNIEDYLVETDVFDLIIPPGDGDPGGTTQAVAVGYYLFLEPLSAGLHTVEVSSSVVDNPTIGTYGYASEKMYNLKVKDSKFMFMSQPIVVAGKTVTIPINSSSTVSDFVLDEQEKQISFKVIEDGMEGITVLPISKVLTGPYVVTVDGRVTTDFETVDDERTGETNMKLEYVHGTKDITITGTRVVPEFSAIAVLVLGMSVLVVIGLTIFVKKRFSGAGSV